ncbi:hypothetical protein SAMN05216464_11393 [Mucilaginibacter pineti]|uniref:Uncharacterized protein n=1 Tax=Mucilaginibacter pineti TaxID=1391627 RepID=A0A1G7INE3_9SPHI|nr:hypothetical protein [Mucilaginibacter pineti]SDF14066.1 hypothetical protein SAMN05216464_11393 [Mucilaginibacter pineti]
METFISIDFFINPKELHDELIVIDFRLEDSSYISLTRLVHEKELYLEFGEQVRGCKWDKVVYMARGNDLIFRGHTNRLSAFKISEFCISGDITGVLTEALDKVISGLVPAFKDILHIKGEWITAGDETAIAAFRLPDGNLLPPSYLQFCRELGYGLLCNLFMIYIPMADADHPDSFQLQSAAMRLLFEQYLNPPLFAITDTPDGVALISAAVPFAATENGEFLFWDTRNRLPNGEYPVYFTGFNNGIIHTGNSLTELILNVTTQVGVKPVLPFYLKPLDAVFESRAVI